MGFWFISSTLPLKQNLANPRNRESGICSEEEKGGREREEETKRAVWWNSYLQVPTSKLPASDLPTRSKSPDLCLPARSGFKKTCSQI